MFVVIFRAVIAETDEDYNRTARRLRQLAREEYGCLRFESFREGDRELTISYWETREQIDRWKRDAEHRKAQEKGRAKWYRSYQIEIAEIVDESKFR